MDQNSGLKAPKKLACLLVKKCGNNGLELGNIKLITLYVAAFVFHFFLINFPLAYVDMNEGKNKVD